MQEHNGVPGGLAILRPVDLVGQQPPSAYASGGKGTKA